MANRVKAAGGHDHLIFLCEDAASIQPDRIYDIVILFDVIEHLRSPEELIKRLCLSLAPGGILLVSVPTPLFPRIFGRRFHKEIGHLVDGLEVRSLDALMPTSMERTE